MRIEVNGKTREVAAETLAALLRELEYEDRHVATALNQTFIRKGDREAAKLQEGDRIEIVSPRQGG
ncbi:MAG: sulfur carrier protein ThiS [Methylocella sp.]